VHLIAVTKTRTEAEIRRAFNAGLRRFGENYLQEALPKIAALADLGAEWHFIGRIQSNKTRDIARAFDWVHTVDRQKTAERLSAHTPPHKTLNVLVQINVDGDGAKGGISVDDPDLLRAVCETVLASPRLRLRGLMTILAETTPPKSGYRRLAGLFESMQSAAGPDFDSLSMGMSGDFEEAVAAGATLVRVGQALFGPRQAKSTGA
jgi:PLP dependent protein